MDLIVAGRQDRLGERIDVCGVDPVIRVEPRSESSDHDGVAWRNAYSTPVEALLVERFRPSLGGLGLGSAMSINLVFGLVLGTWLLLSDVDLPPRGAIVLSTLAVILVGMSPSEAFSLSWRKPCKRGS